MSRPPVVGAEVTLVLRANVAGTAAVLLVVEVTAPDIAPTLVFNLPVSEGQAIGAITLPSGAGRTITAHAYDAGGVETHRGATTINVHPGANPTVQLTLSPLTGDVPLVIALGTVTISVVPVAETLAVAETAPLTARVRDAQGEAVAGPVHWATTGPGVASVERTTDSTATVTGRGGGETRVVASFGGVGTGADLVVLHPGHYVAATGTSAGDGTPAAPWDLQTALAGAGGRIDPGDTVWIRGGTYLGSFSATLHGSASAPIVVRVYPGERAVIDGNGSTESTFKVFGEWAVYWGLEIMNSMTDRFSDDLGLRPTGVYVGTASNIKLVNLIVHDTGHGLFTEHYATNIEIYGWIIFNGGHENGTRADGHGLYIKHDGPGGKVIRDNIVFNQFGHGIHGFTEHDGAMRNLVIRGNVLFNNGELSSFNSPNMLVAGRRVADNDLIAENLTYFSPGHGGLNMRIGHPFPSVLNGRAVLRDNYVVGGEEILEVGFWQGFDVHDNIFIGDADMIRLQDANTAGHVWSGNTHFRDPTLQEWRYQIPELTFAEWQAATGLAATDQAIAGTPASTRVFVRPNLYEAGRAVVVVYNWAGESSVSVALTGVVTVGRTYEVRSVQALLGPPIATGTFTGGTIAIPMTGVAAPMPIGGSPNPPLVTGPAFDVFLVTSRAP